MPRIPNRLLPYLKCRHCRNWLSCGPVHVLPQGSSLCGRCESVAIKQYRHVGFEALAGHFQYPCRYYTKRCPETLRWNEALTHEDECTYMTFCGKLCNHPGTLFKGDRKIDVEEEITFEYVPDFVLDHLRCAVCENYTSCTPVYVTDEGKSICHRCVSPTEPPPNAIRHYAFEILADIIIFPCMYRTRGCPQYFRFGRDMLNHEMDCSYGVVYRKKPQAKGKKERGVIETHTGHVYGTITPNSIQLFAPQSQQGMKEKSEFVDALRKQQERFPNVQMKMQEERETAVIRSPLVTPEMPSSSDEGSFEEKQRNVVARSSSVYSNANSELINELKIRQRMTNGRINENGSDGSGSRDNSVKIYNNLDDIFWVYDEVMNEYRNSKVAKKNAYM